MSHQIMMPWGRDEISLDIPDNWNISGILEPSSLPPVTSVQEEFLAACQSPYGCEPLFNLDLAGKKIAVIMDDASRPTPVAGIFHILLRELTRAQVKRNQITLIPAIGLHRAMTEEEILKRTGLDTLAGMKWENPDPDDIEKQTCLGTTSFGTPVWIHRSAAQADLVISIGCIEPHIIASFGGGYKNIMPGIAGRISIAHNHALNCRPDTFNMVGQPIDQNPMRQDLEEAGKMVRGKVFIINTILDNHQQVVRIVCGDPLEAHRAGVEVSSKLYGVKIPSQADIVISDSHPMDSDLRQGVKALANMVRALKPGGIMITLVKADEGVGVFGLANRKLPVGKKTLKTLIPVILPFVSRVKLRGMGEEDRFFLYFALQAMRMGRQLMYAPTIPTAIHPNLPFVDFISSVQEGLSLASRKFPNQPDVLIFPNGGITYPIL